MKDTIHPLVAAASFVIVVAGLRAAAPIVSLFLLAVLLTTSVSPVVLWQLRRGWSKERAILLTVLGVATASVVAGSLVALSVARLARNLPGYETRLAVVLHSLADSLAARGIDLPDWKAIEALSPSRLVGYASSFLGAVMSAFSDGFLVLLLVLFIIVDGADRRFKYDQGLLPPDSWWGQLYRGGADVRRYVSITAFTGLLGAIANLILLLVLGVDGAVLWAFLSFWLNFIPNVGIILSVIPPALLALVEFGPGRAIVVVVGFLLANAVVEQVLQPRLLGRELELSPLEILVSLLFWGWVLGPIGAVVAVPLTIAVKRLLPALATGLTLPGRDRP